ncbi:MAG: GNAT family N-acetyltransferase [Chloroflexota bacterium]
MQAVPAGRPSEVDRATARWLAWHEAMSHGLIGREVRSLDDAVMLYDPNDREPFWNRVAGIAWPDDSTAFDRRLTEVLALFAALERTPHVWPLPGYDEPDDLVGRLLEAGFEDAGAGIFMALDPFLAERARRDVTETSPRQPGITIERVHGMADPGARDAAHAIATILAESFRLEPDRVAAIEDETLTLLGLEEFHAVLVRVDGEPAATARRTTFAGASYLSSIGTRPAFQGRGLGRLATMLAMDDARRSESRWTYLGVFHDNLVARRMYEGLGFVMLGGPAPDLLLR